MEKRHQMEWLWRHPFALDLFEPPHLLNSPRHELMGRPKPLQRPRTAKSHKFSLNAYFPLPDCVHSIHRRERRERTKIDRAKKSDTPVSPVKPRLAIHYGT